MTPAQADAGTASGDRDRLLARLRAAGVDDEEIERAAAEERLPTLAVELALGGAGRHSLSHVAREAGLAPRFLRELYSRSCTKYSTDSSKATFPTTVLLIRPRRTPSADGSSGLARSYVRCLLR